MEKHWPKKNIDGIAAAAADHENRLNLNFFTLK